MNQTINSVKSDSVMTAPVHFLRKCLLLSVALGVTSAAQAAGISEPPITVYGKVLGAGSALLTEGSVTVTLERQADGQISTVSGILSSIANNGDTLSYSVPIPLEFVPSGSTVSPNTLSLPDVSAGYTLTISVTTAEGERALTDTFTLSPGQLRGYTLQADIDYASADPTYVWLSVPDNIAGWRGYESVVPVSILDAEGVQTYTVAISFDPARAEFVPGSFDASGTLTDTFSSVTVNHDVPGLVTISAAAAAPLPAGGGELLRLRLKVTNAALVYGVIPVNFERTITRLNEGVLTVLADEGSIFINQFPLSTACEQILAVVQAGPGGDLQYDLNGDGLVDVEDYDLCLSNRQDARQPAIDILLGILPNSGQADENGDGMTDASDLLIRVDQ